MLKNSILYFLILFFLLTKGSLAQPITTDDFLDKLTLHSKANPTNLLFVHTDKNIYTNNENIWFSAYLLKSQSVDLKEHTILSVVMLREDNREIYRQEKYVMDGGLAFGSMALPDSTPPGNYQLVAYTNVLDKDKLPVVCFQQKITLKSITQTDFSIQVSLLDSVIHKDAIRVKVQVEIKNPDERMKTRPTVEYAIGKNKFKKVYINHQNTSIITIPKEQLLEEKTLLLTSVKYKNGVQHVSLPLPGSASSRTYHQIRFYPEGGNLVDGLKNKIGWETRTSSGKPISLTAILYENEQAIDTISTEQYGIGSFYLIPQRGSRYTLRHATKDEKPTVVELPQTLKEGIVLHLTEAVVHDTLHFHLSSTKPRYVHVFIHNYQEGYSSFTKRVSPEGAEIKVALPILPKGLATLTILDETGRPLAERLFFAHHDKQAATLFTLNKNSFNKREKVDLKLKIAASDGSTAKGIVSIACVQDNRIDDSNYTDIENYTLLNAHLESFPAHPSGNGIRSKSYLENILLVRGWRRYTWQNLIEPTANEVSKFESPVIKGVVRFEESRLKKAVQVNLLKADGQFETLQTSQKGDFNFSREDLIIKEGHQILASVESKNKEGYSIKMLDPYPEINEIMAEQLTINESAQLMEAQSSKQFELASIETGTTLQEVVVKSRYDGSIFGAKPRGSNECGDYVTGSYLNYPGLENNSRNSPPIRGMRYIDGTKRLIIATRQIVSYEDPTREPYNVIMVFYKGCTTDQKGLAKLNGIYTAREFYGFDEKLKDFSDPQLISTLYWKPGVIINDQGEVDCSFYTGDISGKFRIVVQGIGSSDLIYEQQEFEVK